MHKKKRMLLYLIMGRKPKEKHPSPSDREILDQSHKEHDKASTHIHPHILLSHRKLQKDKVSYSKCLLYRSTSETPVTELINITGPKTKNPSPFETIIVALSPHTSMAVIDSKAEDVQAYQKKLGWWLPVPPYPPPLPSPPSSS
jgi:hypothetical protein